MAKQIQDLLLVEDAFGLVRESTLNAYNPSQPRDAEGKWSSGGGGAGGVFTADKLPSDMTGDVEFLDDNDDIVATMSVEDARLALKEHEEMGLDIKDVRLRQSSEATKAEAERKREEYWKDRERQSTELQRIEGLATPSGLRPGHPGYVEPPDQLYHATFAADKIKTEGLKSSDELGQQTLGGSASNLISFTTKDNAEKYRDGLNIARKAARGELTRDELVSAGVTHGVSEARVNDLMLQHGDNDFAVLQAVSLEGKQFPLFMGTGWPDHLKDAKPASTIFIRTADVKDLYYNPGETEWRVGDYKGVTANAYNPNQPRDARGRWGSGGGAADTTLEAYDKLPSSIKAFVESKGWVVKSISDEEMRKQGANAFVNYDKKELNFSEKVHAGDMAKKLDPTSTDEERNFYAVAHEVGHVLDVENDWSSSDTFAEAYKLDMRSISAAEKYGQHNYFLTGRSQGRNESFAHLTAYHLGADLHAESLTDKLPRSSAVVKDLMDRKFGTASTVEPSKSILPGISKPPVVKKATPTKSVDYPTWLSGKAPANPDARKIWEAKRKKWKATHNQLATNARWVFQSRPQQIAAFLKWLQGVLKDEVLAGKDDGLGEAYWRKFVEEAYQKGQGRAFDDVRVPAVQKDMRWYNGTKEEFLRSSFGRPMSIEKVQLMAGRVFTDLKGVTEAMAVVVSRELTEGFARGDNPHVLARRLKDELGFGSNRAATIARTEVIRSHAEGQLDAMERLGVTEVGVMVEWDTAGDGRVCRLCQAMDGVVLTIKEARGMIPRHPNAVFAGSSFASYGECEELVRAWYCGPAIVLTLRSGLARTTIGPNHPILTPRGMVPAAQLREGDYVLYDHRKNGSSTGLNVNQVPTVENIFESLLRVTGNSGIVATSSDLHGDRVFCQGKVEAIWPARGLLGVWDSFGVEKLREGNFAGTYPKTELRSSSGSSQLSGHSVSLAPSSFVSKFGLLSRGVSSEDDPHSLETEFNCTTIDPESLLHRTQTFSSQVALPNLFKWERIHSVSFTEYEGLAFDATTATSLYYSGGLVVSNCRCAHLPANVGEPQKEQVRRKEEIQAAITESLKAEKPKKRTLAEQRKRTKWVGPDKRIAKKRPVSVVNYNPNQPRDYKGQWSSGGGGVGHESIPDAPPKFSTLKEAEQWAKTHGGQVVVTNVNEAAELIAGEAEGFADHMIKQGRLDASNRPSHEEIVDNWKKVLRSKKGNEGDKPAFKDLDPELHLEIQNAANANRANPAYQEFAEKHGDVPIIFRRQEKGRSCAAEERAATHVYDSPFWRGESGSDLVPGQPTAGGVGGYAAILRHEYGHKLFGKLSNEQQREWRSMVPSTVGTDVTSYAGKNAEEAFCEIFALTTDPRYKQGIFPPWVDQVSSKSKEWLL
ncbi:MAG: phage minor head protein [Dehalococcoidia bacterium]